MKLLSGHSSEKKYIYHSVVTTAHFQTDTVGSFEDITDFPVAAIMQ